MTSPGARRAINEHRRQTEERREMEDLENDLIGALCRMVKKAGLTMTLYGRPVEEQELRDAAFITAVERIAGKEPEIVKRLAMGTEEP